MTHDPPPFRLDLRSNNGPGFRRLREDESEISIHEWTTWLRVRSDVSGFVPPALPPEDDEMTSFVPPVFNNDGLAVLVVTRPQQDFEGRSIGVFSARLDHDELEQLREAVEGIRWAELPRPVGGDVTAPNLDIRYERGSLLIERGFNARSGNFLEAIVPLMSLLERCLDRARKGPAGTLELSLAVEAHDDDPRQHNIRVKLRNRGSGVIALTDPRAPRGPDEPPRLHVRVGEQRSPYEGVEPREWLSLPLPPLPEGAPSSRILGASRSIEFELPWTPASPGSYLVRAKWEDYDGPLEPLPGQCPFMPLTRRGPSYLGSGPYPVRGATFAVKGVEIVDEEPS